MAHRLVTALLLALLSSAACDSASGYKRDDDKMTFSLTLPAGEELNVPPDTTVIVYLLAVGASGEVVFTAENLPVFASLEGDKLTLFPGRQHAGQYPVAFRATSGGETDSKILTIVVEASNRPPRHEWVFLNDLSSEPRSAGAGGACLLYPYARSDIADDDGDHFRLEAEVVPAGMTPHGVPTDVGEFSHTNDPNRWLTLTSMEPGIAYDFYFRAADDLGAASEWVRPLYDIQDLACTPVAVGFFDIYATSGQTWTYEIPVFGVDGVPYSLTLDPMPDFVTLDGNALTVSPAPSTSSVIHRFDVTLKALGYTSTRINCSIIVVP